MTKSVRLLALALSLAAAGCEPPRGEPLVSAQWPPGTGPVNQASEPQPINSLPKGAANISAAPGGQQPDYASLRFRP